MKRHLVASTVLAIMICGFQTSVFPAPVNVEQSKKVSPTIEQQTKATRQLEIQPAEVRNNKQACLNYCKKVENCKCTPSKSCSAGYRKAKRWLGVSGNWLACVKIKYSR